MHTQKPKLDALGRKARAQKPTTLEADDFYRYAKAFTYSVTAQLIGRSMAQVSHYARGKTPIPQPVTDKLLRAVGSLKRQLNLPASATSGEVMLARQAQQHALGPAPPPLYNLPTARTANTRLLPVYRLRRRCMTLYIQALVRYHRYLKQAHQRCQTVAMAQHYQHELTIIKYLALEAKGKPLPYDIRLETHYWPTVSRALRHANHTQARSLYQHWRKHKQHGYIDYKTTGEKA